MAEILAEASNANCNEPRAQCTAHGAAWSSEAWADGQAGAIILKVIMSQVTRSVDTAPGYLGPQEQATVNAIVAARCTIQLTARLLCT